MSLGKKELDKRFGPHALEGDAKAAVEEVNKAVRALAGKLDKLIPHNRHSSLAFTALEDVRMRANASISEGTVDEPAPAAAPAKADSPIERKPKDAAPSAGSPEPGRKADGSIDMRTKAGRALKAAESGGESPVSTDEGNVTSIRRAPRRPA